VVRLLEQHLASLVDYEFTAQMEDFLDAISRHEVQHQDYLREFFHGKDRPGLKQLVQDKIKQVDAREMSRFSLGRPAAGEHTDEVFVRVGKFGPFLEQADRRASIPHNTPPDELTLTRALGMLDQGQREDAPLGMCPQTGKPVYLKSGRFGPYVQLGTTDDKEKKNASLPKGMGPEEVDLEIALKLLALPRTLGLHPDSGLPVVAHSGRYGPFVKCGEDTRSLPEDLTPLDVSLEQALLLLAQPKTGRGRRTSAPKEPLKTFDVSPVTSQNVKLLDGRYGPYVTDGQTNASLPKGMTVESVTLESALKLLAERAAKGPAPKRGRRSK
jgi:DNA topoisomerase-1